MTIYEKLINVCKKGEILSSAVIRSRVGDQFPKTNPASVIPSDYCYNSWNKGVGTKKPLFVKTDSGEYQYLGPDALYTGVIEWRRKGSKQLEIKGNWTEGHCILKEENTVPTAPETPGKPSIIDLPTRECSWSKELDEVLFYTRQLVEKDKEIVEELERLSNAREEVFVLMCARRVLELLITRICEQGLNRKRGNEPLKGIIDKLKKDEIITQSMHAAISNINAMGTFGAHPKSFHAKQVRSVLIDLSIVIEWFIEYEKNIPPA